MAARAVLRSADHDHDSRVAADRRSRQDADEPLGAAGDGERILLPGHLAQRGHPPTMAAVAVDQGLGFRDLLRLPEGRSLNRMKGRVHDPSCANR